MGKLVTVAVSNEKVVVGTANSVVLEMIGSSVRKLGVAKGKSGIPVVKGGNDRLWAIYEGVEVMKIKRGGFKKG